MIFRRFIYCFFLLLLFVGATAPTTQTQIIKYQQLEELIAEIPEGNIAVFNFWATWCKPCIKELPYFEQLGSKFQNVDVYLISLDIPEETQSKVIPFLKKKNIQSKVLVLDETDHNAWINKLSPNWSGAIPATLVIDGKTKQKQFHEGELTEAELDRLITTFQK